MGDLGSTLGQEDPLEKENGNPLQYSCLENPRDGGAWRATVHKVAKSRTRLSDLTFTLSILTCKSAVLYGMCCSSHIVGLAILNCFADITATGIAKEGK